MNRKDLLAPAPGEGLWPVVRMIENGEESRRVYASIAEAACATVGVFGSAVYLPVEKGSGQQEMVASFGTFNPPEDYSPETAQSGAAAFQSIATTYHRTTSGAYNYFEIICLGAPIGTLAVNAPEGLPREDCDKLGLLAHITGTVFERHRLSNTLQHFLDRLQVLNELNQLIATNVGLQRIVKTLAREGAFRFAADVSLAFLLDENSHHLVLKGGYGCNPVLVPKEITLEGGMLSQVMRVGGHLSMPVLSLHPGHGLGFLEELGIRAVDCCCLEVRGEALGAILIGFKRENVMSQNDLTRFEEFAQGAAVAIANARTQERIGAYTERLEELVETRTADLAVQTSRAEEANRAKSQFLANMSHELRTPLTAIVGYASVLADGVFGPMTPKQVDAVNAICRSSEHLKNLIDDVLNLARIEAGKEEARPARTMLKDVLSQAFKLMQQTSISKGVELRPLSLSDDMLKTAMWADAKHLHQILINLMSNAVKYTPKGGKVTLSAETLGDKVKISVMDTGVGIPPQKLAKLFERFERGEDAYSRSQEGTGIGLSLTRSLVELNGGRIGVESQEGKGSTFWVLIPLASQENITLDKIDTSPLNMRLDGLSTLVVDDNQDTCEVLRQILMAAGATVRTATSVKEGITFLEEQAPDIVLTDLAIPGESGLQLIEHVRNSPGPIARVPIIVLSACAFESDKQAAMAAGASAFIAKPFRPAEIARNVRELTLNLAMQQ